MLATVKVSDGESSGSAFVLGRPKRSDPKAMQSLLVTEFKVVYQTGKFRHRMGPGIVVHASAIRETIDRLD